MKVHDIVTIYQDPITETKPEGKACLLHKIGDIADGLEQWKVCFEGEDGGVYVRTIKVAQPAILRGEKMKPERLVEIKKRTPEQVKQAHQDWIDSRDKTIEALAKKIVKRMKSSK